MTIQAVCPECSKSYELADEMAGKSVRCVCGSEFQVAQLAAPSDPLAAAAPAQAADPLGLSADPLAAPVLEGADPLAAPVLEGADPLAAPVLEGADPLAAPVLEGVDPLAAPVMQPTAASTDQAATMPNDGRWAGESGAGSEAGSGLPDWMNVVFGKTISVRITRGVLVTIMIVLGIVALKEYSARGNWEDAYQELESKIPKTGAAADSFLTRDDVQALLQDDFGAALDEGSRTDIFQFGGVMKKYWLEVDYDTLDRFDGNLLRNMGGEYPKPKKVPSIRDGGAPDDSLIPQGDTPSDIPTDSSAMPDPEG
jgi:hypothetical protein